MTRLAVTQVIHVLCDQVEAFHTRQLQSHLVSLYLDATTLNVRPDRVSKEAIHIIVGIIEEVSKRF